MRNLVLSAAEGKEWGMRAVDFNDPDQVLVEAERAGVDLAGLRRNLELSPDERLDQFLKAWAWLEWAKDARRKEPTSDEAIRSPLHSHRPIPGRGF